MSSKFLTVRSSRYAAYAFGLFVFAVGVLLDLVMIEMGAPSRFTLLFDDLLTGLVAGITAWVLFRIELRRREQELDRLRVLDETNHHVRNALQVMVLHAYSMEEGPRAAEVQRAIARIEWTLNEVLPKIGPEGKDSTAQKTSVKSA
jgi:hypothetical protein